MPADFKVQQIRNMLKILENKMALVASNVIQLQSDRGSDGVISCVVCRYQGKERASDRFCVQCMRYFCLKCATRHSKTSIFRDHLVVETSSKASSAKNRWACEKHRVEFKYHCEQCDMALCAVCVLQQAHEGHTILDEDTAVYQQAKHCQKCLDELEEKIFV